MVLRKVMEHRDLFVKKALQKQVLRLAYCETAFKLSLQYQSEPKLTRVSVSSSALKRSEVNTYLV